MAPTPYTIHPAPAVDPASIFAALRSIPTPHLSDNLGRLSGPVGLHLYGANTQLLGTAVTVKARAGDNLMIYKALTMMRPGHVLVVDGGGDTAHALVGELIMLYAIQRGCTGFVVDGAIRDKSAFAAAGMACYARAVSHRGPYKNGPGEVNVPVAVGGQVVHPGDYVVGDEDGVVTFAPHMAVDLVAAARRSAVNEEAIKAEIANGRVEQAWLTRALEPHGLA
jgi:RraA family protein